MHGDYCMEHAPPGKFRNLEVFLRSEATITNIANSVTDN